MFRFITMILSFAAAFCLTAVTAFAKPDWPTDTGVQSESGIVMDMDSGAVLFAQGIRRERESGQYYKAFDCPGCD